MARAVKFAHLVLFLALLHITIIHVTTKPTDGDKAPWIDTEIGCRDDIVKRYVCQHCAKQTKSPVVYPLCCEVDNDVYDWCQKYTTFGHRI